MSGLSRELVKWLQSMDLTIHMKSPKWNITNGYIVAEIFSWYFPKEVQMHSFYNRDSLELKQLNWYFLKYFINSKNLDIPNDLIEGTIHCKNGAAILLLERMFEILTNRKVKKVPANIPADFSDFPYQSKMPMYARSTATKAVKNNIRVTEEIADPNIVPKCVKIINDHLEHRRMEREENPKRFGMKPTLGEQCIRKPAPVEENIEIHSDEIQMESGEYVMSRKVSPSTKDKNLGRGLEEEKRKNKK